jgi:hypothetical protein
MTTPAESASLKLCLAASNLRSKGHYARAAEKYGCAAAAAAQELAAEDCLIVTYMRTWQASCTFCHSGAANVTDAESGGLLEAACNLLGPCTETLTRRKEAGTLLSGCCRADEVAWFQTIVLQGLRANGSRAELENAFANGSALAIGTEAYFHAASCSEDIAFLVKGAAQLWFVTFLTSALDLLASLPCQPVFNPGVAQLASHEVTLANNVRLTLKNEVLISRLGDTATGLLTDAWRRVERSGVLEQRLLGRANTPLDPSGTIKAKLDAADEEAAARGLHTCALAGCAAKEVHVSQFKKCGACMKIAYCCREHQVEAWPAHKAACKAARKAAAPKTDS